MPEPGLQVVVRFHSEIPVEVQGPALLQMEQTLRASTKLDVRVVKDLQGDDSKLRKFMTVEMRSRL